MILFSCIITKTFCPDNEDENIHTNTYPIRACERKCSVSVFVFLFACCSAFGSILLCNHNWPRPHKHMVILAHKLSIPSAFQYSLHQKKKNPQLSARLYWLSFGFKLQSLWIEQVAGYRLDCWTQACHLCDDSWVAAVLVWCGLDGGVQSVGIVRYFEWPFDAEGSIMCGCWLLSQCLMLLWSTESGSDESVNTHNLDNTKHLAGYTTLDGTTGWSWSVGERIIECFSLLYYCLLHIGTHK